MVSILIATSEFRDHRVVDCGDLGIFGCVKKPLLENLCLFFLFFVISFVKFMLIDDRNWTHLFNIVGLLVRYGGTIFMSIIKPFQPKQLLG